MSAALPRKRARLADATNEVDVPGSSAARLRSARGSSPLALHPPKWRSQVDPNPRPLEALAPRRAVLGHQPRAFDPNPGRVIF